MIVFSLPQHRPLLPPGLGDSSEPALGRWHAGRFPDGELWLELGSSVAGRECAVLGSLAPPDEQGLMVLLLAHTLKRAGASAVRALLPYLGYARQDFADPENSLGSAWAGALLEAAGVDEVATIDVHSAAAQACFGVPVVSLSPARLFAEELRRGPIRHPCVVAPDEGALERCRAVAEAAGIEAPVAHLRKRRDPGGVVHAALIGRVLPRAVLVDDILDTGGTLLSACRKLRRAGVGEISIMATHGTFSGDQWRELPAAGAQRIVVTDSVPDVRSRAGQMVEVLSVTPLVIEALDQLASRGTPRTGP
jgi:ribose-phosphate pyrophosphokinase